MRIFLRIFNNGLSVLVSLLAFCSVAEAVSMDTFGRPVTAIGSGEAAVPDCPMMEGDSCFNAGTGSVTFYIPLSYNGVFGVDDIGGGQTAGTVADVGDGLAESLTMYLRFSPVALPVSAASLRFSFVDLDLAGVNDPTGFFETVQFFDVDGKPISSLIAMNNQTPLPGFNFSVGGDSTSQTIFFPDVTSIIDDPFFVDLRFGSQYYTRAKNTPESMIATLTVTQVPEPSSLLFFGAGLAGAVLFREKIQRRA